jgi:hypothetical protein
MRRFFFASLATLGTLIVTGQVTYAQYSPPRAATGNDWFTQQSIDLANATAHPNPVPTGNSWFTNYSQTLANARAVPNPYVPKYNSWLMKDSAITSNATGIPNPNTPRNSWLNQYSNSTIGAPTAQPSLEYKERMMRQGDWENRYQRQFPGAIYNYDAWTLPGSEKNNPMNLYGKAATTQTLRNPNFVGGNYAYKAVPVPSASPRTPPAIALQPAIPGTIGATNPVTGQRR